MQEERQAHFRQHIRLTKEEEEKRRAFFRHTIRMQEFAQVIMSGRRR